VRTVVSGPPLARFDLVLADPPYATSAAEVRDVLQALVAGEWLTPGAVVVVERPARGAPEEWPTPLEGIRDRRYGEALLRYGRLP
jgi:16S rRNA (guanine966-N2)-methyltransferase